MEGGFESPHGRLSPGLRRLASDGSRTLGRAGSALEPGREASAATRLKDTNLSLLQEIEALNVGLREKLTPKTGIKKGNQSSSLASMSLDMSNQSRRQLSADDKRSLTLEAAGSPTQKLQDEAAKQRAALEKRLYPGSYNEDYSSKNRDISPRTDFSFREGRSLQNQDPPSLFSATEPSLKHEFAKENMTYPVRTTSPPNGRFSNSPIRSDSDREISTWHRNSPSSPLSEHERLQSELRDLKRQTQALTGRSKLPVSGKPPPSPGSVGKEVESHRLNLPEPETAEASVLPKGDQINSRIRQSEARLTDPSDRQALTREPVVNFQAPPESGLAKSQDESPIHEQKVVADLNQQVRNEKPPRSNSKGRMSPAREKLKEDLDTCREQLNLLSRSGMVSPVGTVSKSPDPDHGDQTDRIQQPKNDAPSPAVEEVAPKIDELSAAIERIQIRLEDEIASERSHNSSVVAVRKSQNDVHNETFQSHMQTVPQPPSDIPNSEVCCQTLLSTTFMCIIVIGKIYSMWIGDGLTFDASAEQPAANEALQNLRQASNFMRVLASFLVALAIFLFPFGIFAPAAMPSWTVCPAMLLCGICYLRIKADLTDTSLSSMLQKTRLFSGCAVLCSILLFSAAILCCYGAISVSGVIGTAACTNGPVPAICQPMTNAALASTVSAMSATTSVRGATPAPNIAPTAYTANQTCLTSTAYADYSKRLNSCAAMLLCNGNKVILVSCGAMIGLIGFQAFLGIVFAPIMFLLSGWGCYVFDIRLYEFVDTSDQLTQHTGLSNLSVLSPFFSSAWLTIITATLPQALWTCFVTLKDSCASGPRGGQSSPYHVDPHAASREPDWHAAEVHQARTSEIPMSEATPGTKPSSF